MEEEYLFNSIKTARKLEAFDHQLFEHLSQPELGRAGCEVPGRGHLGEGAVLPRGWRAASPTDYGRTEARAGDDAMCHCQVCRNAHNNGRHNNRHKQTWRRANSQLTADCPPHRGAACLQLPPASARGGSTVAAAGRPSAACYCQLDTLTGFCFNSDHWCFLYNGCLAYLLYCSLLFSESLFELV